MALKNPLPSAYAWLLLFSLGSVRSSSFIPKPAQLPSVKPPEGKETSFISPDRNLALEDGSGFRREAHLLASQNSTSVLSQSNVVTWGGDCWWSDGADSSCVADALGSSVQNVTSTNLAFAALKTDGSVVTWGDPKEGGDSETVRQALSSSVKAVYSNNVAFAAVLHNGSVVTWGVSGNGGNSMTVQAALASGRAQAVYSTELAFAAITSEGNVITWGHSSHGARTTTLRSTLESGGFQTISSTLYAFAAVKMNGSITVWGDSSGGGDDRTVRSALASGVRTVRASHNAFAAVTLSGHVVSWGAGNYGGDSLTVRSVLTSENVQAIYSNERAFAAVLANGSVVTWGYSSMGGNSDTVRSALMSGGIGVIFSTPRAFAAVKHNTSLVTWGVANYGGSSASVTSFLASKGIKTIHSTSYAFAAVTLNGSLVAWGSPNFGGNAETVRSMLASGGVQRVYASDKAFAAVKSNNHVVTWGQSGFGENSATVRSALASGQTLSMSSTDNAFAAVKAGGSVVSWGHTQPCGGSTATVNTALATGGVQAVVSTNRAFAAWKSNGSVVAWGSPLYGGDSETVRTVLMSVGIQGLYSSERAFAVITLNGSVITWGDSAYGGDSKTVRSALESGTFKTVYSTRQAFAALRTNGSIVTWGSGSYGGNSKTVLTALALEGVREMYMSWRAFAAVTINSSVITWGSASYGGNSATVRSALASGDIKTVYATNSAFTAVRNNGSVVIWGNSQSGGNSGTVRSALSSGVVQRVFSSERAFVADMSDGSVVAWGNSGYGSNTKTVNSALSSGNLTEVYNTQFAFAAKMSDGSLVVWGSSSNGGSPNTVNAVLASSGGVQAVYASSLSFAALTANGSVVTWGGDMAGNSQTVHSLLASGVRAIYSTEKAFMAVKSDGSIVSWGDLSYGGGHHTVSSINPASNVVANTCAFAAFGGQTESPTQSPTTASPTTGSPTTTSPTTRAPSTMSPSTTSPSSNAPTTLAPSTVNPSASPSTGSPTMTGPTPILARFNDAITMINVYYNFPTNAPGSTSSAATCNYLLDSSSVLLLGEKPTCIWESPTQLNLHLGRGFLAVPSSLIITKPDIVQRKDALAHAPTSGRAELRLELPPNPPTVSVSIVAPEVIGACDAAIALDSVGQGSAGRPFVYNWTFIGSSFPHSSAFTSSIQDAMRAVNESRALVRSSSFRMGNVYSFRVHARNWLGISSSATHIFRKSSKAVPILHLPGPTHIVAKRSEPLNIAVQVRPAECSIPKNGGERVILSTLAQWHQASGPTQIQIPQPTSAYLRLPAFVLDIGSTYQFSMIASTKDATGNSVGDTNVTFTVNVTDEPVQAVISGGSERLVSLSAGAYITFDGEKSIDTAYQLSRLSFNWSLTNVANGTAVALSTANATSARISANHLVANQTYMLELIATSNASRRERSGKAVQIIRTTVADIPSVSIKSRSIFVNVHTKLTLSAVIRSGNVSKAFGLSQRWYCTSGNFNLSDSRNLLSDTTTENLIIRPNSLTPGSTYTFSIKAWYSGLKEEHDDHGEASVTIQTNYPPVFGTCKGSPPVGTAMITSFRLSCEGWTDVDLPLRYQFQMVTSRHTTAEVQDYEDDPGKSIPSEVPFFLDLCEPRQAGYYSTVLSASDGLSNVVTIRARIVDNMGASSSFIFSLTVLPLPSSSLSIAEQTMKTRFGEGDIQEYVVLAAGVSSQINSADDPTPIQSATSLRMSMLRNVEAMTISNGSNLARVVDPQTSAALVERITAANRSGEVSDDLFDLSLNVMDSVAARTRGTASAAPKDPMVPETVTQLSRSVANVLHGARASRSNLTSKRSAVVVGLLTNLSSLLVSDGQVELGEDAVTIGSRNAQDGSTQIMLTGTLIQSASLENAILLQKTTNCKVTFQRPDEGIGGGGGQNVSLSSSVLQLGLTTITGSSLPYYEARPAQHDLENGIVKIEVRSADSKEVRIENTSQPIRFTIPGWEAARSSADVNLQSQYNCTYWNGSHWSGRGLSLSTGEGVPVCESSHLTLFALLSNSFRVEVNTFDESDISDARAYNPAENPVMLLAVVILGVALLSFPVLRWYDRNPGGCIFAHDDRRMTSDVSFNEVERDFWRLKTQTRYLHTEAKGSCANWMRTSSMAMRTRHPWLALLLRHPGDYMNSQKRLLVLLVLLLNSAVVCALLEGTSQNIFFLTGNVAQAIVACFIAFPIPYIVSTLFSRSTPKEFKIPFSSSGLAASLPWLFFIVSICAQELHDGITMEDDEDGGDGDDGDDGNQERQEQDDEDTDEEEKDDYNNNNTDQNHESRKAAQSSTKAAILSHESTMATNMASTAGTLSGWVAGDGDKKKEGIKKGKNRRSVSIRMHFKSSDAKLLKRTESFYGFVRESMVRNNEWTLRDGVASLATLILILGCVFLLVVLSWSNRKESTQASFDITLLCYGQDICFRIFTIVVAEAVVIAMLSFSSSSSAVETYIQQTDEGRKLRTITLPCDKAVCTMDNRGRVEAVTSAGKRLGIQIGWLVVRINGEAVSSDEERRKAVRRAHALGSHFSVSFEVFPVQTAFEAEGKSKSFSSESVSFHTGIDPEQDFPYQPPTPRARFYFGCSNKSEATSRASLKFERELRRKVLFGDISNYSSSESDDEAGSDSVLDEPDVFFQR
mmetsp:Transcript_44328/g.73942  ORF Transcript_44328/g.73942 Transcript_44328/m.73942 type:complete len:2640 (-) Transcript_44328:145-8064(-)